MSLSSHELSFSVSELELLEAYADADAWPEDSDDWTEAVAEADEDDIVFSAKTKKKYNNCYTTINKYLSCVLF